MTRLKSLSSQNQDSGSDLRILYEDADRMQKKCKNDAEAQTKA